MLKAYNTHIGWLVVLDMGEGNLPIDTGFPAMTEDQARLLARMINVDNHVYG